MRAFFKNNSLSLVFLALFFLSVTGQLVTGWKEHNEERTEEGAAKISITAYMHSGHFLQATFENWESEFLQMALFVILTIFSSSKRIFRIQAGGR